MNIYSVKRYPYGGSKSLNTITGSLYPIDIGGRTFNKNNYGTITLYTISSQQCTTSPVTFAGAGQTLTLSETISGYNNEYGLTRLIYTDAALSSTYFEKLSTTTISGRFRFKETFTAIPAALSGGIIDVNVSILGKNFIALTLPVGNSDANWFYTNKNSRFATEHLSTSQKEYLTNNTTIGGYASLPNKLEAPADYVKMFSTSATSKTFTEEYSGAVWDFGNTPQLVPQILSDWVLDNSDPIYPYTFTVKSQNGFSVLSSINEAPSMVSANIVTVGNQKTLTLTGINGREYTMTWKSETPEGKTFKGLSLSANGKVIIIPTGKEVDINFTSSTTLYESYETYRPPLTTFPVNLYNNSAESTRVDKTDFLEDYGTLNGALREQCGIMRPSITFQHEGFPSFNYVYIAAFNRYYFVTNITSVNMNLWRMDLVCDVLMSYKDIIKNQTAIIRRQETAYNLMLQDTEILCDAPNEIVTVEFPNTLPLADETGDASYLVQVVGDGVYLGG